MAYIETLAPRDWGFYTLFAYPYVEGVRNFSFVFPSCQPKNLTEYPSLLGRIGHLAVGLLLIIPLINTVAFIILREVCAQTVFIEPVRVIPFPASPTKRTKQIEQLNEKRGKLLKDLAGLKEDSVERKTILSSLKQVELEAANVMKLIMPEEVSTHLVMSRDKDPKLTKKDGKITDKPDKKNHFTVRESELPKTRFRQLPGLSQRKGFNHLCGYYALFFMLQAVTDKKFSDRDIAHPLLNKWLNMISVKRTAIWLQCHRDQEIPYGLEISSKGLNTDDMQYLIDHSEELAILRETAGCFVLEIDEFLENKPYSEPIKLLGKSKTDKKNLEAFPIYFIFKAGIHYYFAYAEKPGRSIKCVHSLNYSLFHSLFFDPDNFRMIVQALTGSRTPMQLKW